METSSCISFFSEIRREGGKWTRKNVYESCANFSAQARPRGGGSKAQKYKLISHDFSLYPSLHSEDFTIQRKNLGPSLRRDVLGWDDNHSETDTAAVLWWDDIHSETDTAGVLWWDDNHSETDTAALPRWDDMHTCCKTDTAAEL